MTGLDLPLGLEPGQTFAGAMRSIVAGLLARETQVAAFAATRLCQAIDEIEALGAASPADLAYKLAEIEGRLTSVVCHPLEGRWLVYPQGSTDQIGEVWTAAAALRDDSATGWFVYRWTKESWGWSEVGPEKTLDQALVLAGHIARPGEVACAS